MPIESPPTWDETEEVPAWDDSKPVQESPAINAVDVLAGPQPQNVPRGTMPVLPPTGGLMRAEEAAARAAEGIVGGIANLPNLPFQVLGRLFPGQKPTPEMVGEAYNRINEILHPAGVPPSAPTPVEQGAGEFAKKFIAGAAAPENLALMTAAPAAPGVVGRLFQTQMISQTPQAIQALTAAKTPAERTEAALNLAAGVAIPAAIEAGIARVRPAAPPIPDIPGRALRMPEGARPPTATETTPPVPAAEMPTTPTETGIRPAIRLVGGKVVVGDAGQTHPDIIKANSLKAEDIDQRGFVDTSGKFLDREQAAAVTPEVPTAAEPERRHSTDLAEAKPPEAPPVAPALSPSQAKRAAILKESEGDISPFTKRGEFAHAYMGDTLELPEGWTVKNKIPSKHGSFYWELEDADGNRWKVSVRDHPVSDVRASEMGRPDISVFVKDVNDPEQFAQGMTKLEERLKANAKPPVPSKQGAPAEASAQPKPVVPAAEPPTPTAPKPTLPPTQPEATGATAVAKVQTPLEALKSSAQVRISAPEGATQIRVTDAKGRQSVQSLDAVNKKGNPFRGVDAAKIEAGTIGRDGKFRPMAGDVGVAPKTDTGIGASARKKWASATDPETPLGSEAGFIVIPDAVKDLVDRTMPYVKAVFTGIRDAAKENYSITKTTDYRRSIFNWSAKLQKSFSEAAQAQDDIRRDVPNPVRREGITNWIQAGGDTAVLAQRRAATAAWRDPATGRPHPQQKQLLAGYDAALNLTPEEISVANDAKVAYDALANRGMFYDVLKSFKDNYVTQIWNLGRSPATGFSGSRMLKDKFKFSKASTFPTFFDGEQAGYVPKTKDISSLLPVYLHEMNSVIAARQLVEQMSKGVASDGRPLLAPRGVGVAVDGPKGKATLVLPDVPKDIKVGGKKMDTSDYVFLENQPALHEWVYATKDSAGNPVFNRADLLVHPEVAARFKNTLGRSAIKEWYSSKTSAGAAIPKALARGIDFAQSETKRTMLGLLTPFHQVQEGTHAIGHKVNPFFNNPTIDLVHDAGQMDAARHGLMLLPDKSSAEMFMEGFRQSGLVTKIPGLGPLAAHYQNYLFHEYIPGIKYKTYQAILERNSKRYAPEMATGKVTLEDVKILSAEQANAAYGHLNYADLGRNPTIQHLMRLGLLAPDFLEARARFAGQAIKGLTGGKIGREQLIALATLAVAQATLSWTAAKLTGGTWDEKDPFTFHVGNRKFTMRSVPEDLYRSVKDHRAFWYARLNPLIGKGGVQYLSGTDWRGQKVSAGKTTKELLTQPVPLALRPLVGIGNTPLSGWEEIAGAAGLKISRYSVSGEMRTKAHEWMAASRDPKIQAAEARYQQTTFPDSDYKPLREALIKNDVRGARQTYDALLRTRTPEQISRAFSTERPFTGSNAAERQFYNSLSAEDKELYQQAKKEHRDLTAKLGQMLRYTNPR